MNKDELENCVLKLSELLLTFHGNKSKFILLVDEYKVPVTNSVFDVTEDELKDIAKLRDIILGNMIKLENGNEHLQLALLAGVADVTCREASPLNNISRFKFLQNGKFFPFLGLLDDEFSDLVKDMN